MLIQEGATMANVFICFLIFVNLDMGSTNKIDFIDEETVKKYFNLDKVFSLIETALADYSSGQVEQPARIIMPASNGTLITMPGYLKNQGDLGCKIVTYFPGNPSRGLDTILANIFLFNNTTGQLQAVMSGTEITGWRTALASAVATKHLHPAHNNILTILGAGVQGRTHAVAFSHLFNFTQVRIWNRSIKRAVDLVKSLRDDKFVVYNSSEEAVRGADVICTVTASPQPLLKFEWLKPGVQINAVGSGVVHYSEVDIDTYKHSLLITDSMISADKELAGLYRDHGVKPWAELGQIINGKQPPSSHVIIFQSLGMAVEDVITAKYIYEEFNRDLNQTKQSGTHMLIH